MKQEIQFTTISDRYRCCPDLQRSLEFIDLYIILFYTDENQIPNKIINLYLLGRTRLCLIIYKLL